MTLLAAGSLLWLALLTEQEGDLEQARQMLEESSESITQRGYAARHQYQLGRLLTRLGEYKRSESVLRDFLHATLKFRVNVRR